MIKFRQKDFSILSSTIKGASIGASVAGIANRLFKPKDPISSAKAIGGGFIGGAALGALLGVLDEGRTKLNRKHTVDNRLMKTVVEKIADHLPRQ